MTDTAGGCRVPEVGTPRCYEVVYVSNGVTRPIVAGQKMASGGTPDAEEWLPRHRQVGLRARFFCSQRRVREAVGRQFEGMPPVSRTVDSGSRERCST